MSITYTNRLGNTVNAGTDARNPGLSGDQAMAKRNGLDRYDQPRNVVVTGQYIYLINGNYDQTIRISR